jgi:pSer/pThr/pTyr-binding forkhead associated (FHA) protein
MTAIAALLVIAGPDLGLYAPIGRGGKPLVVGRDPGASLQVTDATMSRRHFGVRFDQTTDRFLLFDLGSANRTLLNGRPILASPQVADPSSPHAPALSEFTISEDDEIRAGDSTFMLSSEIPRDRASALELVRMVGERHRSTLIQRKRSGEH